MPAGRAAGYAAAVTMAADELAPACHESTGGNALLLAELLRSLEQEGRPGSAAEARHVREAVAGTVARTVVGRLRRLSRRRAPGAARRQALADRARI